MCDQTEVSYLENDVVWVKIGRVWWPGVVKDLEKDEEGKEILAGLKKKPIAVVKFFQEDNYEFVKNLDQIYHYSCRRKDEFIKKGLDKFRTGEPHMKKFPSDVTTAESLTNGDLNIINDPKFLPEKKESYSEIFGSGKKKSKKDFEVSPRGKVRLSASATPYRPITHQRFINKVLHGESDHRVKTLIQLNSSSEDAASINPYKCHVCKFETSRVNVIVAHHRLSHSSRNSITWSGSESKLVRRKPVYKSRKIKIKKFDVSRDEFSDEEDSGKKKSPKGKFSKTKTKTNDKDKNDFIETSPSKRKSQEGSLDESLSKKPRFTDVLLADWDEEEDEEKKEEKTEDKTSTFLEDKTEDKTNTSLEDNESKNESNTPSVSSPEKTDNSEVAKNQNEKMSCFDFDEEEEGFIGMSNANTYGRKIPRVIPVKDKTELGMDLEIEELFKKKIESEVPRPDKNEEDSDTNINSYTELNFTNDRDQEEENIEKSVKGPGRRRRSKASKEEELKVIPEDSLALRRTRRPGAKKSYLNEVIEKIEDHEIQSENEQKDEEKPETEKKVEKIVKEETGSSSRRKQDFKQFTLDGDRDEIIYSNVINVERKAKTSDLEKKKTKSLNKDSRRNNEDLTMQIDNLLEETKLPAMPEISDHSVKQTEKLEEQKSANFSFDYLPGEQMEKKIAQTTKEVKSISRLFSDSIPNVENSPDQAVDSHCPQSSQEEKPVQEETQGKNLNSKHSSAPPKRGSIVLSSTSKTSETGVGKVKVLPVMRQGTTGKDCIILPAGKKLKYLEEGEKSEEAEASPLPKNIKAIKVKSDSLPPSLITGGKLKGQTIIHQKGGKYVIVTQSPSLARQKATPGKVQSGSKVVILTNQLGEQKIITTGGLQQTKFKIDGQKLIASSDSVTDKTESGTTSTAQSQPMIKMVPDGKGGIMKQLTVSPKKLLLGGTKVLMSGSGSTFSTGSNVQKIALSSSGNVARTGGDFRLIENYKGSGKMVLIPENTCGGSGVVLKSASALPRQITKVIQTPQAVQSVKKKPKILMRASTSQGDFVTQTTDTPGLVVKQKGADGKFPTQKILRTELINQPKPTSSGTKTFFISGQGPNKKGESFIITTNESVAGKVIRMRQKVKEVDASSTKATQKIQKAPEVYTISQSSLLVPSQTAIESETPQIVQLQDQNQQSVLQTQVIAMPGPVGADGNQTYVLVSVDENGIVQGMDNSVVAYDTVSQPNSIFVSPTSSNNVILINPQTTEVVTPVYSTSSQDILAEALANTNVLEGTINNEMDSVVPSILLPPSIPSSVVQETSITLQKPIMTPLEMPSSVTPDTSGLEPPPLPPTPTEEDVLMEDSESGGVLNQEQQPEQNEIKNSSNNIQAYLEPETFDSGNPTKSLQGTDSSNQKVFEETKPEGDSGKKTSEYFQSELSLNSNEQEDYKKLHREEYVLENPQEQSTHSFQSLPVLSDEPDTSDAPSTEPNTAQQFDGDKSRAEPEEFSKLLREQEPPSSTNNEVLSENQGNEFDEFKYDKYSHTRESENSEDPKSKELEDKLSEEQFEVEKESTENRESMPVITEESNINAFEIDPMYSEVISQKRFQEETEVSSTTDEFSNKDVAN